jgi:hypothetical protein
MQVLKHVADKAPDGLGYNNVPVNMTEITEKEFVQSPFFTYSFSKYEHRQAIFDVGKGAQYQDIKIFWLHDGSGYCMITDFWDGKLRYFRCGCNHSWVELTASDCRERNISHYGNCYHVYECSDCGYVKADDSSG